MNDDKAARIKQLEQELETLKQQWPAHSVSPALLQRLDDLEDDLAEAIAAAKTDQDNSQ